MIIRLRRIGINERLSGTLRLLLSRPGDEFIAGRRRRSEACSIVLAHACLPLEDHAGLLHDERQTRRSLRHPSTLPRISSRDMSPGLGLPPVREWARASVAREHSTYRVSARAKDRRSSLMAPAHGHHPELDFNDSAIRCELIVRTNYVIRAKWFALVNSTVLAGGRGRRRPAELVSQVYSIHCGRVNTPAKCFTKQGEALLSATAIRVHICRACITLLSFADQQCTLVGERLP